MTVVYNVLVVLHLLGMAAVVGSWLAVLRAPHVVPGMLHGALLQLVTGLALVGMRESKAIEDDPLNHTKIGVKLLISLVIAVLAWVYSRPNRRDNSAQAAQAIGGLAVLNVIVAVMWV